MPKTGKAPKKLYLHIGHYKTGTTALQALLSDNGAVLARCGLDYLDHGRSHSKHSRFAFSLLHAEGVRDRLMHGYGDPTPPEALWAGLFDAVRASRRPACLISSEEFMRIGAHPRAAARLARVAALAGDIEIRVIVYLRAPDSHLRSWYNQLVKMGVPVPPFNRAVCEVIEPVHYDYALALKPWIDIFGADAVTIRPFPEAGTGAKDTALYADFLSIFGIGLDRIGLALPPGNINARLDPDKLEFVRLMQNADMPAMVVSWAQKRAEDYLDREAGPGRGEKVDFATVTRRAREALEALETLAGNDGVTLALFGDRLPAPDPEEDPDIARLAGFLLSELRHMQRLMHKNDADLRARLEALEKRIGTG